MNKYNINDIKKAALAALEIQVLDARHDVDQYDSIVNSLTEKATKFQTFLQVATSNRTLALKNKNSLDEIIQNARNLNENSSTVCDQIELADEKFKKIETILKKVVDELIYSAQLINKLSTLVIRKKAQNPLISDDLVHSIAIATKDANNAVALSLTALKSAISAQVSVSESKAIASVEYGYTEKLYEMVSVLQENNVDGAEEKNSIKHLIDQAALNADLGYAQASEANEKSTAELSEAELLLDKASIKLNSLESELAAAKAAALGG